jgi:hypothetical protein
VTLDIEPPTFARFPMPEFLLALQLGFTTAVVDKETTSAGSYFFLKTDRHPVACGTGRSRNAAPWKLS